MTGRHRITKRSLAGTATFAGVAAVAVVAAAPAAADPGDPAAGECVRNLGGPVVVDGGAPVAPIFGFEDLRLIGLDGGSGNACITNLGPGSVSVTRPAGRVDGRTSVSAAPVEMRVDGGIGNVAVTNVGVGAVTVDRRWIAPGPAAVYEPAPEGIPELVLDAGRGGVFVTNVGSGSVTVADWDAAEGPLPAEIPAPPGMVVTDPITGNVYVTSLFGPAVTVVHDAGSQDRVVDRSVVGQTFDHGTGNVFVTNIGGGPVTVIRK